MTATHLPFFVCVVKNVAVNFDITIYGAAAAAAADTRKISAFITLPESYPATALGLKYRGRTIFVFSFTLYDELPRYRYDQLLLLLGPPHSHIIFINEFYFYPKTANVRLTPEEQGIFRGVAKRAARRVLAHVAPRLPPPATTLVCLEASGTVRTRHQQDARERELEQTCRTIQQVMALVAQYRILDTPDFYNNLPAAVAAEFKSGRWQQWPRCDWLNYLLPPLLYAEDNVLLAQYYTRNFHLDVIDDSHQISQIFMATTLDKMLLPPPGQDI
jgi:hypothetical protein